MINIAILDNQKEFLSDFKTFFSQTTFNCLFTVETIESLWFNLENETQEIRFLLLDIMLETESGLDVIAKVNRRFPQIEIIMLTAVEDSSALIKAFSSGASGYILKSNSFKEIEEYLTLALDGGGAVSPVMARKLIEYFRPKGFEKGKMGPRTQQVLHFLAEGWSYKMIASNMGITVDGVRFHIKEIYRSLNVQSKPQAVRKYLDGDY